MFSWIELIEYLYRNIQEILPRKCSVRNEVINIFNHAVWQYIHNTDGITYNDAQDSCVTINIPLNSSCDLNSLEERMSLMVFLALQSWLSVEMMGKTVSYVGIKKKIDELRFRFTVLANFSPVRSKLFESQADKIGNLVEALIAAASIYIPDEKNREEFTSALNEINDICGETH